MVCPKCLKEIGSYERGTIIKEILIVKREGYYRIFKSEKEIEGIRNDKDGKNILKEINYMTLDEYKKNILKMKMKK